MFRLRWRKRGHGTPPKPGGFHKSTNHFLIMDSHRLSREGLGSAHFPNAEGCRLATPIQNRIGICPLACEKMVGAPLSIPSTSSCQRASSLAGRCQPKEAAAWTRLNFQPEPPVTTNPVNLREATRKVILECNCNTVAISLAHRNKSVSAVTGQTKSIVNLTPAKPIACKPVLANAAWMEVGWRSKTCILTVTPWASKHPVAEGEPNPSLRQRGAEASSEVGEERKSAWAVINLTESQRAPFKVWNARGPLLSRCLTRGKGSRSCKACFKRISQLALTRPAKAMFTGQQPHCWRVRWRKERNSSRKDDMQQGLEPAQTQNLPVDKTSKRNRQGNETKHRDEEKKRNKEETRKRQEKEKKREKKREERKEKKKGKKIQPKQQKEKRERVRERERERERETERERKKERRKTRKTTQQGHPQKARPAKKPEKEHFLKPCATEAR